MTQHATSQAQGLQFCSPTSVDSDVDVTEFADKKVQINHRN